MTTTLTREIEKYLSKKNPYYSKFSQELLTHLSTLYPSLPTVKSQWFMLKNNLTENDIPVCGLEYCNNKVKWNIKNNNFNKGCSPDHSSRITSLENFGTEYPNQNKKQLNKLKQSVKEKYGVEYITQTDAHKATVKATNQKKYGVDSVLQSPQVREKIKTTNLEKYGVEEVLSSDKIQSKVKETMMQRYGVESSLSSPEIREKINKTNISRYGSIFPMKNEEVIEKRKQHIIDKYDSYSPLVRKDDSCKYFHLDKSLEAENIGQTYYYFFDDEKLNKKEQITWLVNNTAKRVVHNIEFNLISATVRDKFISKNSLYQKDSEIRHMYGVYNDGELIAIISGYEKNDFYEITRFVVKMYTTCSINIIEEYIKFMHIKKSIIITLDRRFTPIKQPMLESIGFEFIGGTEPKNHRKNDDEEHLWDCGKLMYKKL